MTQGSIIYDTRLRHIWHSKAGYGSLTAAAGGTGMGLEKIIPHPTFSSGMGGVAYVIIKPKKQKQVSTLQELVFIFIDI